MASEIYLTTANKENTTRAKTELHPSQDVMKTTDLTILPNLETNKGLID